VGDWLERVVLPEGIPFGSKCLRLAIDSSLGGPASLPVASWMVPSAADYDCQRSIWKKGR
jgi:hypothetical protein